MKELVLKLGDFLMPEDCDPNKIGKTIYTKDYGPDRVLNKEQFDYTEEELAAYPVWNTYKEKIKKKTNETRP